MRWTVVTVLLSVVLASCGTGGEGAGSDSPGGSFATTTSMGESPVPSEPEDGGDSPPSSPAAPGCEAGTICETDYLLEEVLTTDEELEEIVVSGTTAYVTTDDGAVVVVDLDSGIVVATHPLEPMALDVAVDDDEVWVLTLDGPAMLDPVSGALTNQGVLERKGSGYDIAIGEDRIWVATDGTGELTTFDRASGALASVINDYDNLFASGEARVVTLSSSVFAVDVYGGRVLQIDTGTDSIVATFEDLGYEAEGDGSITSINAIGPTSLTVAEEAIWVLADLVNPDGAGVSGAASLFRIDPGSPSAEKMADLVGDPEVGAAFAVTDEAVWYLELTSNELIRVDRETRAQHRLRLPDFASGHGLATGDGSIWVTAGGSLFRADIAAVAEAIAR